MIILFDNFVASLDFDPNGEVMGTIDLYRVCLVSEVNTNRYSFHLKIERSEIKGKLVHYFVRPIKILFC